MICCASFLFFRVEDLSQTLVNIGRFVDGVVDSLFDVFFQNLVGLIIEELENKVWQFEHILNRNQIVLEVCQ